MYCDVCNFADDTAPYVCDKNFEFVLTKLENHSDIAIKWFEDNYTKMNSDKCLVTNLSIHGLKLVMKKNWETKTVKLLGITIDSELKFDEHLNSPCLKENRKLSAVMRIRKLLDFNKTKMLFFGGNQYPGWHYVHERALRLVYNSYE